MTKYDMALAFAKKAASFAVVHDETEEIEIHSPFRGKGHDVFNEKEWDIEGQVVYPFFVAYCEMMDIQFRYLQEMVNTYNREYADLVKAKYGNPDLLYNGFPPVSDFWRQ